MIGMLVALGIWRQSLRDKRIYCQPYTETDGIDIIKRDF